MTSLNHVVITGKVIRIPRFQHQPDGTPVLQFPLELNGSGDPRVRGERGLVHIVAFGKLAEAKPGFQAGQRLLVKGRLCQRTWRTLEGRHLTRTEVIASELCPVEGEPNPHGHGDVCKERR